MPLNENQNQNCQAKVRKILGRKQKPSQKLLVGLACVVASRPYFLGLIEMESIIKLDRYSISYKYVRN